MIAQIVPCGVVPIHWLSHKVTIDESELHSHVLAEEWERAGSFKSERRRAEYLRSRYLMRKLTGCSTALPSEASGNPTWPEAWVGSITHKDGEVGVALLPRSIWLSVGIDAENPRRMREEFAAKIASQQELSYLKLAAAAQGWSLPLALTILFSFKESLFKAHFPLGKRTFYFHDVEIESITPAVSCTSPIAGLISAVLKVETSPLTPVGHRVEGFYQELHVDDRSFILTSIAVPRPN